jgi:uncharacterized alpha-E superfamily protein
MVVSMQQGGGSKDTWILSSGPVPEFSLLTPTVQPVELSRAGNDLPSRAADNLYWLGRYAERAEGAVRLLRGILVRLTEKSGLADVPELPHLLRALTYQTLTFPGFIGGADELLAAPVEEVLAVIFDDTKLGSLAATVKSLHRVVGTVRDRISIDMWRVVNRLDLGTNSPADTEAPEDPNLLGGEGPGVKSSPPERTLSDVLEILDQAVSVLAAFGGLAMESMTRGQAWRFLDMGRRIERALHMIGLVRHTLIAASGNEGPLLEALLEIADSSMTYRRRYMSNLQTAPVLDLLLADETNPRSLVFQLAALAQDIDQLPHNLVLAERSSEQRLILMALTAVRLADIDRLAWPDPAGNRTVLAKLLETLEENLPALSDMITSHYLSHLLPARHLAAPN